MTPSTNEQKNPFVLAGPIDETLYGNTGRLRRRINALKRAKVVGNDPSTLVTDLARKHHPQQAAVLEVGCGLGSFTEKLWCHLSPIRLTVVDNSLPMLLATGSRMPQQVETVLADFHSLPLPSDVFDLAVAAFCLYHSATPGVVCGELWRCLRPGGCAIFVTKSEDSYQALDRLVQEAGIDPLASLRPSLYRTFHSGNAAATVSGCFKVEEVLDDRNVFRFVDPLTVAEYIATSPKYGFPPREDSHLLVLQPLKDAWGGRAHLDVQSTVTVCVGRKLSLTFPESPRVAQDKTGGSLGTA